jgi:Protein of unknown function (DUF2815)
MKVFLKEVRLSFPDLFVPTEYEKGDGKPRYNATLLVVPGSENDKAIQAAIKAAAEEVFGAKSAPAMLKQFEGNSQKYCYLDGNTKEYDGYANHMYLACHSKTRPGVYNRDKTPLTAEDGKPYAGCYVNASVEIYAQNTANKGIRAAITGVQFVKDGDAFGSGAPASPEEFEDLGVPDTADDMVG